MGLVEEHASRRCSVCAEVAGDGDRCGACGAQRLLDHDGHVVGHAAYAGLGRRLLAALIDAAAIAGPFALAFWLLPRRERLDLAAVGLVVTLLYPLALTAWSADTWGKRVFAIHVVGMDGRPPGRGRVSAREGAGKTLELLLLPVGGLAAIACIAFDERRQALHDKMAGTVAVRGGPRIPPLRLPGVRPQVAGYTASEQTSEGT